MHNVKLTSKQIRSLTARFHRAMVVAKHTKKDVEMFAGLRRQYQVSRLANGQFKTLNKSVQKICNYADCILWGKHSWDATD